MKKRWHASLASNRRWPRVLPNLIVAASLVAGWAACSRSDNASAEVIARYRQTELVAADVWRTHATPAEDSAATIRHAATSWLREQVLAQAAVDSVPGVDTLIAPLLARYRNQLLQQALRRHLLAKADSTASDTAILSYYTAHRGEFPATTAWLQYRLLRVPASRMQPDMVTRLGSATDTQLADWGLLCVDQDPDACYLRTTWTELPTLARLGLPDPILREAPTLTPGAKALWAVQRTAGAEFVVVFALLNRVTPAQPLPLELVLPAVQAAVRAQQANIYLQACETRLLQQAFLTRDAVLAVPSAAAVVPPPSLPAPPSAHAVPDSH